MHLMCLQACSLEMIPAVRSASQRSGNCQNRTAAAERVNMLLSTLKLTSAKLLLQCC